MAKPQLEDGFTRIAHEILEVTASAGFSGQELSFLLILWRFTFGWRTTWASWSNKAWAEGMGVSKQAVNKVKLNLLNRKVIILNKKGIRFNKDWQKWGKPIGLLQRNPIRLLLYPNRVTQVTPQGYKKKKKPKEIKDSKGGKDKKDRKIYKAHSKEFALSEYLYEKVTKMFTDKGLDNPTEWNHATEAAYMDRLMRLKKQSPEQIREVIDGIVKDEFWQTIHFSPRKFYEKWDTLVLKFGVRMIEVPVYDNHGKQVGWKKQKPIS